MTATTMRCPGCAVGTLPAGAPRCSHCGMSLIGPAAAELWQVQQALLANDQQRRQLQARRDTLLGYLRSPAAMAPSPAARPTPGPRPPAAAQWVPPQTAAAGPAPETSQTSVQNLLLALGGLLLAIAAIVFTVVAWGRFGIGGRATILLTFTGIALAAPVVLVRRKLSATAETVAVVGVVLMALDGYAAYHVNAFGLNATNGYGYTAALLAVVAATATAYARVVPLRLPTPIAIVIAQPIVPLIAAAQDTNATGYALAFAIVAGLDVALIVAIRRQRSLTLERVIAVVCAALADVVALPIALALTFFGHTDSAGAGRGPAAGVLAFIGAVIIGAAVVAQSPSLRVVLAGAGPLLVATAAVGALLPHLGSAGYIAPAAAALLLVLVAIRAPALWRVGGLGAGAVMVAAGGVSVSGPLLHAVLGPFSWLGAVWAGAGDSARVAVDAVGGSDAVVFGGPAVLPAVVLLAGSGAVIGWAVAGRRGVAAAAAAGAVLATAVAPIALDLTRPAGLIVQGAVAAVLCLTAALFKRPLLCRAAGAAGLTLTAIALAGCTAESTSTIVGLAVAMAVFAFSAVAARYPQVGAVAAGLFGLAATAQTAAALLAAGNDAFIASWAMLGVAALAAGCGHLVERRLPQHARALTVATVVAALSATINAGIWIDEPGLLFAVAGAIVVAAAVRRRSTTERAAFFALAMAPVIAALAAVVQPLVEAYVLPYAWLGAGWGSAPHDARDAVAPGLAWSGDALMPAVLGAAALAVAVAAAALWGRRIGLRIAVPAAAVTLGLLPLALGLPWAEQLITLGTLACALLAVAVFDKLHDLRQVSAWTSAGLAGTTMAWSLAAAPATVIALAVTAAATLLATLVARTTSVRLVTTVMAGSAAVLTAVAGAMAAGEPARFAAFTALAVAAGLAGVATLVRHDRRKESLACELVAAAGALLAIGLSAASLITLSIALAATGLVVGAVALRPDRRPAGYVGTALVILGSWVRLAELGINAPEAYTVPVGVAGLVIGWLRWRQGRQLPSWLVFGPGLASALLPSLAALYLGTDDTSQENTVRPFALGAAALVVVLVGGSRRLQAPLVLGGGVLAAVALHELAPWVADVVGAMPRWIPLAAAGLLLLLVGATYEQRRRDLRNIRDTLLRMS